jgi:hypothetical protein
MMPRKTPGISPKAKPPPSELERGGAALMLIVRKVTGR